MEKSFIQVKTLIFLSNRSRLVELANEIEKAEKEEEISMMESRLKELSQLSSEILHSFGLKNFKPSSLSSQLCGAIVTPTVLDPEGMLEPNNLCHSFTDKLLSRK